MSRKQLITKKFPDKDPAKKNSDYIRPYCKAKMLQTKTTVSLSAIFIINYVEHQEWTEQSCIALRLRLYQIIRLQLFIFYLDFQI
jgi:hypothetical protein